LQKYKNTSVKNFTFAKNYATMLKIGVLGAGHLGKIHIKCIQMIPEYQLVGFYDVDQENAKAVSEEFKIPAFNSIDELVDAVDVVDIVTPTIAHYECAAKALKKFRHVFIEKPVVTTIQEAKSLIAISREADVKVQVGHVERFNPAFLSVKDAIQSPVFIEGHRLAMFNPRGTDVPVVLDLMIHDIDIVLSVVKSKVKKVFASGVKIVSDTPDIANARLEFDNGCVANLTASRISMKNMRKLRFFQPHAYISVDFLDKTSEIIQIRDANEETIKNPFALVIDLGSEKGKKEIFRSTPEAVPVNAIQTELKSFYDSITKNQDPVVSIFDGYYALEVAHMVLNKINEKMTFFEL
jgi:predicted dehydrogenase